MSDRECIEFLRWALPRLGLRWAGFRRVRRQVCKRLARRLAALELPDLEAYRELLARDACEWAELEALCRVTISRFFRDRGLFERLRQAVLPELARAARARGGSELRVWSIGCASGEEPYSLRIVWENALRPRFPDLALQVLATDVDPVLLERAARGCYAEGSLRDVPAAWREGAFEPRPDGLWRLRNGLREGVNFRLQDVRRELPTQGPFDLVLCRNLVFTYFDDPSQRRALARLGGVLVSGGCLALGAHERLPSGAPGFEPWSGGGPLFRRVA